MRRLRIAQMISTLEPRSAMRTVHELAVRLAPDRFEVEVISLRDGPGHGLLRESGVPVGVLQAEGLWNIVALTRLARMIARGRYDVVHTHLLNADALGRPARRLADAGPLVHTVHVAELRHHAIRFAYARLFRPWCARVICASELACEVYAHRTGTRREQMQIIRHAVDPSLYARDHQRRATLRRQWGLEPDRVVFAYVGRLAEHAGVDTLLSAASHLAARGEAQTIVFAGEGPMVPHVENYLRHGEGGRSCRYLGAITDIRGILSAADVLLLPDRAEGAPLAAAEGMAVPLALVATTAPGVREVVAPRMASRLVSPGDASALAEEMSLLARNGALRRSLAEEGRLVSRSFDIDEFTRAHEQLYLQAARAR